MACNKNCSNNCSGGCYGALNCISGPLTHCGCCSGNSQYYQNYPFYTGPCPAAPCNTCGCSSASNLARRYCSCNGWNGWNSCCSASVSSSASNLCSSSANFVSPAPLLVAGGEAISLSPTASLSADFFSCSDGGILIRRPGSYMAIFTLNIPALHAVSTRLCLRLNGDLLEESSLDIAAVADATASNHTSHMIFHAFPNSMLQLVSSEDINISPGCELPAAVKLTLVRL